MAPDHISADLDSPPPPHTHTPSNIFASEGIRHDLIALETCQIIIFLLNVFLLLWRDTISPVVFTKHFVVVVVVLLSSLTKMDDSFAYIWRDK